MIQARGRGKVVPRQAKLKADRSQYTETGAGCPANAGAASSRDKSSHLPAGKTTTSERELKPEAAAPPSPAPSACSTTIVPSSTAGSCSNSSPMHLPTAASTAIIPKAQLAAASQSPGWRCAHFLEGGQPQQLSLQLLGTAMSRQLMAQHQPLLMTGQQLATCRLAATALGPTAVTAAPKTAPESAAHANDAAQHQQNPQQHKLLSTAASGMLQQQQQHQQKEQTLLVLCSNAETNRFMLADSSKNLNGSYYHLRKPETSQLQMTFREWLDRWQAWQQSRLLLQVDLCTWELPGATSYAAAADGSSEPGHGPRVRMWPNIAVWPHLPHLLTSDHQKAPANASASSPATDTGGSPAAAAADVSLIDWPQLQQLLADGLYQPIGKLQLLAGGRDALLPAKYHTQDRLLMQVAGKQKLLLLPPELGFRGMYPYPVAHPYDRYSCVDWEEPELEHWHAAAQVKGLVCELSPGDSLLIPAYWFVHSQLMQPACVALALQLQPLPNKLLRPAGLLMQLSRMIEAWVGAEVGTANVRQWLMALSEGREWQLLEKQLATVKGFKQLQVCHLVLQQLQQVLALGSLGGINPATTTTPAAAAAIASNSQHHLKAPGAVPSVREDACVTGLQHEALAAADGLSCSALEVEARQLLGRMCEERLMPTHWLNQGITDPLYLKHQPQYYLIREDEEAARYPGLFKHRLIANRPDWMQHAEPLQLAPPGSERTLLRLQGATAAAAAQHMVGQGVSLGVIEE